MSPRFFDGVLWFVLMLGMWFYVNRVVFLTFAVFVAGAWAIITVAEAYLAHRDLRREYERVCDERNEAGKRVQELEKIIEAMEEGVCLPFPSPRKRA